VAYWDADWKDIIIYGEHQGAGSGRDYQSALDEAIKDGFDGIYLDWVEAFEDRSVLAAARAEGLDPAQEMVTFIEELGRHSRGRRPGFLIVQQNGAALVEGHPELTELIDGLAQEAIWYDGDATDRWDDDDGYDWENDGDLSQYYLDYLDEYLDVGLPVFNCEYALGYAAEAYELSQAAGLVPYVTRRSLGRLTTTPPPDGQ
jgi:cysteinyl-tRNA synthetase